MLALLPTGSQRPPLHREPDGSYHAYGIVVAHRDGHGHRAVVVSPILLVRWFGLPRYGASN